MKNIRGMGLLHCNLLEKSHSTVCWMSRSLLFHPFGTEHLQATYAIFHGHEAFLSVPFETKTWNGQPRFASLLWNPRIGARTLGHPYPNWERNPVGFLWWPPALLIRHVLGIDQMRTHTLAPQKKPCQGCVQERKRPRLGLYRKIQGEENGSKRWKQVCIIMRYLLYS